MDAVDPVPYHRRGAGGPTRRPLRAVGMRRLLPLLGLAVLLAVPAVVQDSHIRHLFIVAFLHAVIASNWNLTPGHAGLFTFGHLTFFGVGVCTAAIPAKTAGVNPRLAIPAGDVAAAATALLIAASAARLKGDPCRSGDLRGQPACHEARAEPVRGDGRRRRDRAAAGAGDRRIPLRPGRQARPLLPRPLGCWWRPRCS